MQGLIKAQADKDLNRKARQEKKIPLLELRALRGFLATNHETWLDFARARSQDAMGVENVRIIR